MARVLLLCEYPTLCGGELSMLSTFKAVEQAGYEILVAAPAKGHLSATLRRRGVETVAFDCQDTQGTRRPLKDLRRELGQLLVAVRPALFHANSLSMGRLSGPVVAELGFPSLSHLRDIVRLSKTAYADLNEHSRLLAVSEATRRFHLEAGLPGEHLRVLYNGVDLKKFHPKDPIGYLHRELNLPPEAQLIGTIGQISLRKGTDLLLETARQIVSQNAHAHFVLVGTCHSTKEEAIELDNQTRTAAQEGELAGRLHLLGTRHDVPALLRELALLLHPARQEPLGRVLLEAAASGLPTVASRVGGTEEIFPSNSSLSGANSAILVDPDQPSALAQAVGLLLNDSSKRKQLSEASRKRAAEAFDLEQAGPALIAHYHEVIDRGKGSILAP